MPVAVPVDWGELEKIERSDAFSIADVKRLLKRAKDRRIKHWGAAGQRLPRLG
jgi:bifunctional non-homologous end joining protein LigD